MTEHRKSPQQYHATCGRRRMFLSLTDAHAYERGYHAHPDLPLRPFPTFGPEWDGYFDREDEVMEKFDRENDWGDVVVEAEVAA